MAHWKFPDDRRFTLYDQEGATVREWERGQFVDEDEETVTFDCLVNEWPARVQIKRDAIHSIVVYSIARG